MDGWKCCIICMVVVYLVTATSALNYGFGAAARIRRNAASGDILIFDDSDVKAKLNDVVELQCGVQQGTASFKCSWETEQGEIFENDDLLSGDVYDNYSKPKNLANNQCGIVIDSVQKKDFGTWKCWVFVGEEKFVGTKRLVLESDSLGGGAIAGIVIGVLLGVALLIGVVVGVVRHK